MGPRTPPTRTPRAASRERRGAPSESQWSSQRLTSTPTEPNAAQAFEREVMAAWPAITQRVDAAVTERLRHAPRSLHDALDLLAASPSLLAPMGRVRDEVTHTRLLAWLLGLPGEIGREARRAWLARFDVDAPPDHWHVRPEAPVPVLGKDGRIDVRIEVPGRWLFYVEGKIDAPESPGQLSRYHAHLAESARAAGVGSTLVFLTADGRASEEAVPHERLAFTDLALDWLPLLGRGGPDATYLAAWVTTILRDLTDTLPAGPVETWTPVQRLDALTFLGLHGGTGG